MQHVWDQRETYISHMNKDTEPPFSSSTWQVTLSVSNTNQNPEAVWKTESPSLHPQRWSIHVIGQPVRAPSWSLHSGVTTASGRKDIKWSQRTRPISLGNRRPTERKTSAWKTWSCHTSPQGDSAELMKLMMQDEELKSLKDRCMQLHQTSVQQIRYR